MAQNCFVSIDDLDILAFEDLTVDAEMFYIPLKTGNGEIVCENQQNGRAFLRENLYGVWCDSRLDETTTAKIYKILREDT
jgi:hypothetical protein